jgi:hypothetical protein
MKRIYANESSRLTKYCAALKATLTKTKLKSPRHIERRTKHIFDWMAHAINLAKESPASMGHFLDQLYGEEYLD